MAQFRIIVLDAQPGQHIGAQIKTILEQEGGYRVDLIHEPPPNLNEVSDTPPDLIIPVFPASKEGPEELLAMLSLVSNTSLLPVMRYEELDQMLDGLLPWTRDFIMIPLREAEVRARVRRSIHYSGDHKRNRAKEKVTETLGLAELVGEDPAFLALKRKISLVAQFESTVLLTGETGTGKERFARALHYLSGRSGKPFLPVNCGAIPVELFENELFGHQKGAFTSAWCAQPGLIAEAEGGTLFLDEIETLSLGGQVKLLRFLQDQSYYSIGSPKPRHADVWIIASTNVELPRMARDGTFRQDLFYRLAVITLALPPLRLRQLDIPLLIAHFLGRHAEHHCRGTMRFSRKAMDALCHHSWPGNVRELENLIEQLVVLTEAETIELEDLPISPLPPSIESKGKSLKQTKAQVIEQFEKAYLTELLHVHHGNVTHAALEAKKERRAFGRLIKKYRIATH